MVVFLQLDLPSATHMVTTGYLIPTRSQSYPSAICSSQVKPRTLAVCNGAGRSGGKVANKSPICTADELHYVPVPNSPWRLALWRYTSSQQGPKRNHPLLLLSGVGTNAIGYDLGPESSFARYMSSQGFDTWILEVRGAGLSIDEASGESQQPANTTPAIKQDMSTASIVNSNFYVFAKSELSSAKAEAANRSDNLPLMANLTGTLKSSPGRLSDLPNGGILQRRINSGIASQVRDWSQKFANIIQEGRRKLLLQGKVSSPIDAFQEQLDIFMKYDWDFDHYLEEDVPAAVRWNM